VSGARDLVRQLRAGGFTLIEMLAVILLTSIVMTAALNHYLNLSQVSQRATERTAEVRRATAILDRVGRDLSNAMLVARPDGDEALGHPWIFFGEAEHSETGADRLRFMSRGRRPRPGAGHQSDFEVVSYGLRRSEDEDQVFELMRWSSIEMPDGPERDTPTSEDDGAQLLAGGIVDFSVTFIDEFGEKADSWDSSLLEDSSELPVAADVVVALHDPGNPDGNPMRFARRVVFPIEPLDMAELTDPTSAVSNAPPEGEEDEVRDIPEDLDDPNVTADCLDTPCAGLSACFVIRCRENLGRTTVSNDRVYETELANPRAFCSFRGSTQVSVWDDLIPNPACR
jgi:type II secretion system protein J